MPELKTEHEEHDLQIPYKDVGQTAIFVAWTRRAESQRPDALFQDPFAAAMLDLLAKSPALESVAGAVRQMEDNQQKFPEYFAVRTRFFDDRIQAALRAGARQVVSLGSGFDGRPLRLACPPGTDWYEVDLPQVSTLKGALVTASGLEPTCRRHDVAANLNSDWATPLRAAGFDPDRPTVWLVEGLSYYLSEERLEELFTQLSSWSAPGSTLLLEHLAAAMLGEAGAELHAVNRSVGVEWLSARDDLGPWLSGLGWDATVFAHDDPAIGFGRTVTPVPTLWLVSATRTDKAA